MTSISLEAYGSDCTGISALACEVDINLVEALACNGKCTPNDQALTSIAGDHPIGVRGQSVDISPLAISLGAISSMVGPNVYGAQPMYALLPNLPNSSYTLPSAYSDVVNAGTIPHWTQANLTDFINVTTGALAIYIAQAWPSDWIALESQMGMPRLDTSRSYALLAAPGIVLASVGLLALLSVLMHRSAGTLDVRLGSTSEILISGGTAEVEALIWRVRSGGSKKDLEDRKMRFGVGIDGRNRLGPEGTVRPFSSDRMVRPIR